MGGFWARVGRGAVWDGFPFQLQQIGKFEAFLIHNSSQLPHAFEIPIFFGCKSKPLAGGTVGPEDVVEDHQHRPTNYFESIYAVPWNQGKHATRYNKFIQVHHIDSKTTFTSSDK